jgi:hypothetical protein
MISENPPRPRRRWLGAALLCCLLLPASARSRELRLPREIYRDRVHAVWAGQIIGMLLAYPFEHRIGSDAWVDGFHVPATWELLKDDCARVDDDWYYEIVALRAFEKYGIPLTVQQLGRQWLADSAGSWGSSAEARRLLLAGLEPPDTGHPRYNPLWYTIGPQFSADIYGAIAPGLPNLAGNLARRLGHIHGYAEGADGGVFIAGMVSLAFAQSNVQEVVRQAASLIHASSPYRVCLDAVIRLGDAHATFEETCRAVSDRWHPVYPATNNAVANGGFIAVGLWFGKGDFLKTMNLICRAADFTDADCNAANAGAVLGALHGTKCLPPGLLRQLHDTIRGASMGSITFHPPVQERISDLSRRTAELGERMVAAHGARAVDNEMVIPLQEVQTQAPEVFRLSDLMQYWNRDWELHGAGFGYRLGFRGSTRLEGDVLATYPRDEVRGVSLRRKVRLNDKPVLSVEVGVDSGRAWRLNVWLDNRRIDERLVETHGPGRFWQTVRIDLSAFAGREVQLRLYQLVLDPSVRSPGSAYWRNLRVD